MMPSTTIERQDIQTLHWGLGRDMTGADSSKIDFTWFDVGHEEGHHVFAEII